MSLQTTEQPRCNKKQVGEAETPSMFKKFRHTVIQTMKYGLGYVLKHPWTWRFLMVHVPDFIDKAGQVVKDLASLFTDLF